MKHKRITLLAALLFSYVVFVPQVKAYIDPATTTYVIQIISALVITLGVTIGMFFTRLRLSILNLYVRISGFFVQLFSKKKGDRSVAPVAQRDARTVVSADKKRHRTDTVLPGRERLSLSLILGGAFSFTFVLFGIYELFMLNTESFLYPLGQIIPVTLLMTVLVFTIVAGILFIVPRRAFGVLASLVFGVLLAGYVQGNFLNGVLGQLTGDSIAWEAHGGDFLINRLIWALLLSIPFLVRRISVKAWHRLLKGVSALLIVIQFISMLILYQPYTPANEDEGFVLTTKNIYETAADKNVIVIVLDRLDNRYIESVLAEDPAFFDRLDGFTRFTNNMSLYSQTFPSVANMFSGKLHMFERANRDYLKDAWADASFLPGLYDAGYTINLYMEQGYTYSEPKDLKAFTDNVIHGEIRVLPFDAASQFMRLSALRYAPLGAKPFFWTTTERFAQLVSTEAEISPYITDDVAFYDGLKEQTLDVSGRDKQFTYLHLRGPHAPYEMNERAERVTSDQSGSIIQTKGSFHIVYEYLDQLRALGLYKDSTIVITGDHGSRKDDRNPLDRAIVTGLFVKPAGYEGEPLATNDAPVSSDNLRPFIYEQAGLDHATLGPTYFEVAKDSKQVRYLYHRLIASEGLPSRLLIYEIKGDANSFSNWTLKETRVLKH